MTPNGEMVVPAPLRFESDKPLLDPFHIVALCFQRARQLKAGARPRVEPGRHSLPRLAQLEVLADTVSWTVAEKPPERVEVP
jgi:DNA-directed RNA polymerase subunit K/omega